MDPYEGSESGTRSSIHFQLQFDKPLPSQVKLAEWNPEKDLLAMVTEESKVMLHRLNWQRLWTISPGGCVTSLCWHPDGKVLALGLEDGTISLHDVENGRLLRSMKSHQAAVTCLNWEEDTQPKQVALSKDLCHLIVTCSGELAKDLVGCSEREITGDGTKGVYCLVLDTSIFMRRGVKRFSKVVCGAGKEVQLIVLNHLQPAADIISFRMGDLKALSKCRPHDDNE